MDAVASATKMSAVCVGGDDYLDRLDAIHPTLRKNLYRVVNRLGEKLAMSLRFIVTDFSAKTANSTKGLRVTRLIGDAGYFDATVQFGNSVGCYVSLRVQLPDGERAEQHGSDIQIAATFVDATLDDAFDLPDGHLASAKPAPMPPALTHKPHLMAARREPAMDSTSRPASAGIAFRTDDPSKGDCVLALAYTMHDTAAFRSGEFVKGLRKNWPIKFRDDDSCQRGIFDAKKAGMLSQVSADVYKVTDQGVAYLKKSVLKGGAEEDPPVREKAPNDGRPVASDSGDGTDEKIVIPWKDVEPNSLPLSKVALCIVVHCCGTEPFAPVEMRSRIVVIHGERFDHDTKKAGTALYAARHAGWLETVGGHDTRYRLTVDGMRVAAPLLGLPMPDGEAHATTVPRLKKPRGEKPDTRPFAERYPPPQNLAEAARQLADIKSYLELIDAGRPQLLEHVAKEKARLQSEMERVDGLVAASDRERDELVRKTEEIRQLLASLPV